MDLTQIRRILVVGAGTMGGQIGLQCALHGYEVVLFNRSKPALETTHANMKVYFDQIAEAGLIEPEAWQEIQAKVQTNGDLSKAARDIDLVSESIFEDPGVKGQVFSEINKACPPHTIFTTNTSTLLPSQFAAETGRASKFAALHFHNPVWEANVVDIMPHPGTDPAVTELLLQFAQSIGQIPILIKKEHKAYIFNSILDGILSTSVEIAANEVASIQDIDRAWMGITKMRLGPFGIMDLIGIDLIYHIYQEKTKWLSFLPPVRRQLDFLKAYMDKEWFGRKKNRGFYSYPNPEFERPDFAG